MPCFGKRGIGFSKETIAPPPITAAFQKEVSVVQMCGVRAMLMCGSLL